MSVDYGPWYACKARAVWPQSWAAVAVAALLCAGSALLGVRSPARAHPPHVVLDARFATSTDGPHSHAERDQFELWVDGTAQRARLLIAPDRPPLYYVRDGAGAWYVIGRPSARSPWRRSRLPAGQEPSLLTIQGIRTYFARLRAQAVGAAVPVDLRRHLAYAFVTSGLAWPFADAGPSTVWLDGLTGLPLQFRDRLIVGAREVDAITTVESIRTRTSSALPADFFTPSGQNPAPWAGALRWATSWLHGIGTGLIEG